MTEEYVNGPLEAVAAEAERLASQGAQVFQKFTCSNCGARLTIDVPNTFYTEGHCEQCDHVTNIRETGCNMLVVFMKGTEDDQAPGG